MTDSEFQKAQDIKGKIGRGRFFIKMFEKMESLDNGEDPANRRSRLVELIETAEEIPEGRVIVTDIYDKLLGLIKEKVNQLEKEFAEL